ncbi:MAG: hypothetical protein R6W71_02665 [Bacteroidales bacterium]
MQVFVGNVVAFQRFIEGHALDQKIKELERSNRDMKAVIEKLKNLDIRLERRRNRLE